MANPLMLDEQQERLLAQGLREGRPEAWQALYDAYAERVWRAVARLLGPRCADVADVVQETMLAAARSARAFDRERGPLWMWLAGIARNHALVYQRKQDQGQRLLKAAAGATSENEQQPTPFAALAAVELATLVRATLGDLSAEHALLLSARYLDGETVTQIALRERASEVAVRSKLARARQAFRAAFARYAPDSIERPAEIHHEPP